MRDIKISRSSHGQESAYSLWPSQKGMAMERGQVKTSAKKCYTCYTCEEQDVWLILLLCHSAQRAQQMAANLLSLYAISADTSHLGHGAGREQ